MPEVTATEAARGFSALFTAVEDGETFVITRRGRVIAGVEPAAGGSGAAVKSLLRARRPDVAWAEDVEVVRELLQPQERQWLA